jgi:GTPase SAR1 family protein
MFGSGNVGKTSFNSLFNEEKREDGKASIYFEDEKVTLNVTETSIIPYDIENFEACFLMFDNTCKGSYSVINAFYEVHKEALSKIPVVLCGNKVDCKERNVKPKDITLHKGKNMMYFDISARARYNFEKPYKYLLEKLMQTLPDVEPFLQGEIVGFT